MKKPQRKKSWAWSARIMDRPVSPFGSAMFGNDYYMVIVSRMDSTPDGDGFLHLSIKNVDNAPIRDWRHFQRIKDELVGQDREAIELYPRRGRVVDEANQYHLWVMPAGFEIQIGYRDGQVCDADIANRPQFSKQRPFGEDDPYRLLSVSDLLAFPQRQRVHPVPEVEWVEQEEEQASQ